MLGALVCLTSAVPSPFDVRALGAMDQQVRTLEARGLLERFPSWYLQDISARLAWISLANITW